MPKASELPVMLMAGPPPSWGGMGKMPYFPSKSSGSAWVIQVPWNMKSPSPEAN